MSLPWRRSCVVTRHTWRRDRAWQSQRGHQVSLPRLPPHPPPLCVFPRSYRSVPSHRHRCTEHPRHLTRSLSHLFVWHRSAADRLASCSACQWDWPQEWTTLVAVPPPLVWQTEIHIISSEISRPSLYHMGLFSGNWKRPPSELHDAGPNTFITLGRTLRNTRMIP